MLQAVAEIFYLLHRSGLYNESEQSAGALHLLLGKCILRKIFIKNEKLLFLLFRALVGTVLFVGWSWLFFRAAWEGCAVRG